ncbi:unnamed protein product [Auanema sp. JU1783]|nr:unnamed protein product [Auanema sp. JU1783]
MSAERSNHEKTKMELTNELESVLKAAISNPISSKEYVSSEITLTICNVIEAVFIHGLRDPFFLKGSRYAKYPEPNFWPFVSKFSHRGITNQIRNLNQIKTEIGKSRAWIRIVLNEKSLEHYVDLLLNETKALSQFYNDYAFLKDSERIERLKGVLKGLSLLSLNAATNSSLLNSWTPSPLILAGLVSGKPLKSSTRLVRKLSKESEEVGTNALDIISGNVSPNRMPRKVSDDDVSSTYSHPSLLDRNDDAIISSTPRSECSFTNGSPDTSHQPLLVHRRTACPRKHSIGSSSSNPRLSQYVKEFSESRNSSPSDSELNSKLDLGGRDKFDLRLPNLPQEVLVDNLLAATHEKRAEKSKKKNPPTAPIEIEDEHAHRVPNKSAYEAYFEVDSEARSLPLPKSYYEEASLSPINNILHDIEKEKEKESSEEGETLNDEESAEKNAEEDNNKQEPFFSPDEEAQFSPKDENPSFGHEERNDGSPAQIDCDESTGLGTSLLEEIANTNPFNSHDESATSNTLMGRGWTVAKSVETEANCLSSSSSTDCSIGVVSFGQALRSALEQDSPTVEEKSIVEEVKPVVENAEDIKRDEEESILKQMTVIPFEKGLPAQDFRCPMCCKSIGPQFGYSKYGCCGMDGLYYCLDCFTPGGVSAIPARVIQSWDWSKRDISQKGRNFLNDHNDDAIITVSEHNDGLYDHCPALQSVKDMRHRLSLASRYLFTCRPAIAEELRKKVDRKEYIYENVNLYSFSDLEAVKSGSFERQLTSLLKFAIGHILACMTCKQKGFVCEVCNAKEVIYPFNTNTTHRCFDCFSVFHLECAQDVCPKCARRARYETSRDASDLPLD